MTKINSKLFPKKSSELARSSELAPSELAEHPCIDSHKHTFLSFPAFQFFRSKGGKMAIQGCWANSDGANSDDRANSDDFLGKSLNFFPSYFLLFLGILTT